MLLKGLYHNFYLRIAVFILLTIAGTYLVLQQEWVWFVPILSVWSFFLRLVLLSDKRNAQKVAFMFDAIDNSDYAFRYATRGRSSNDKLVSESLNRITQILFQAKADAAQKEKYYELIMNCVNTGIIVLDDNGVIYQTNNEALRLLGLAVFTNVRQLARIDENLKTVIQNIQPGDKHQISFTNERGNVHLSIRVSEMTLQDKHVRILAINDINSELDDKEIDSWIRLTRVLTHEIMNSVTPITSLSDTLLSLHQNADDEIRNGLEVISTTGKSLISFVESYRKFTHIPTQAIGCEQADGLIEVKAYCNEEEAVLIEVSNNGPVIPQEEAEHIFVPFFTTKEGGSGIGLSISRQIMRLSGGSIALKSAPAAKRTTFVLTFP